MDPISWKVLMSLNFSVSITNIASWALVRAMLSDLMFNFSYNTTPPPSGEKWYYSITDTHGTLIPKTLDSKGQTFSPTALKSDYVPRHAVRS